MRKIYGFLALFVLMASSVMATDLNIIPDLVTMSPSEVVVVDACIEATGGGPLVGADLTVEKYCRDNDLDTACDDGTNDDLFPGDFSAVPLSTPTDATGCGTIKLTTSGASGPQYAYHVNGDKGAIHVEESGLVLIPEFTTIGAGLVLAGAGFYMYRKRSRK